MVKIEKVREVSDKVFSALVTLMAVVFFITSLSLPGKSGLLPKLVAAFIAILNLPVVIGMWRKNEAAGEEKIVVPVYYSVLVLIGYYLALMLFGYIISSLALMLVIGRMSGQKNWILLIILAVIIIGSSYYIFGSFFGVMLPKGLIFDMLF